MHGVEDEIKALQERADAFQAEADTLGAERKTLAEKVDEDLLKLYNRLLKTRGAPVVVSVFPQERAEYRHLVSIH